MFINTVLYFLFKYTDFNFPQYLRSALNCTLYRCCDSLEDGETGRMSIGVRKQKQSFKW